MPSDIKLDGDQVVVEGADLLIDRGQEQNSVSLNLKNLTGFWHISGPRTYEPGNPLSIFWNNNDYWSNPYLTINTAGNVGIGTPTPEFRLDIVDRMRVRQAKDTAGIWLYQTKPARDQAFIGMSSDTQVGFWGNTGAGWGLVMDTTTGNVGIKTSNSVRPLHVEGAEIHSGGSGSGFSFSNRQSPFVEKPSSGERWVWYSDSGTARLWSGEDKLSIDSKGNIKTRGNLDVGGNVKIMGDRSGTIFEVVSAENPVKIPGKEISTAPVTAPVIVAKKPALGSVTVGIGTSKPEKTLDVSGDARVTGTITATTVTQTSSKALKENVAEVSTQEAISALVNLNPVKFNFKSDDTKKLHVGFIAEDVPELVAMSDRETLSAMDIVAVLTKVVQEQHQQISCLVTEMKALKQAQKST